MREVIADINRWQEAARPIALATVIQTWGSAPRKTGAKMALTPDGQLSGSVSGGCVEGAVFEIGVEALAGGQPKLVEFGVADETAWDVGLACGGSIRVWIEPFDDPIRSAVVDLIARDAAGAVITVIGEGAAFGRKRLIRDGAPVGSIDPAHDAALDAVARDAIAAGRSREIAPDENPAGLRLFVDVILPAPQLVMVGGVHIAIALASIAQTLGYRTVVVDPRRAFGSAERFAHADVLDQRWPRQAFADITVNENTAVALLTHDPKIDDPAILSIIDTPAFYIGALGSTRTHAKRRRRLAEAGLSETQIDRIHAPIGLDINAQTPEEIAVAVMAEIVAARRR